MIPLKQKNNDNSLWKKKHFKNEIWTDLVFNMMNPDKQKPDADVREWFELTDPIGILKFQI